MMLFVNNFLITGVNPANNEKGVAVNTPITIQFAVDMDITSLTKSNIILRKVNGGIIEYSLQYINVTKRTTVIPLEPLESGTKYQLQIVGGTVGVKSITGTHLGETRAYLFTTNHQVLLTAPASVAASVSNGFVTVTWAQPDQYDPALTLSYELMISRSSLVTDPPIWPSVGDINFTGGTTLSIPKQLSDGNYYAFVRAKNNSGISEWSSYQFHVAASEGAHLPSPSPVDSGSMFEVVETYPKANAVDITPESITLIMSAAIDQDSVDENTVYIVPKVKQNNFTMIDFLTEFAPNKRIESEVQVVGNIMIINAALEEDREYTVVIRESVKSVDGETLGEPYAWSFMSKFSILYGDSESIRDDVGTAFTHLSDKTLYKYMRDISRYAYEVVSRRVDFNPSDYEDGRAPYYVHQYVRFQVAYDLTLNAHMQQSAGSGSSVRLGDLTVDKRSEGVDVTGLLQALKDKIRPWRDLLHGHHNRGYAKPVSVVKGENGAAYPDFLTRAEYRELGQ